jgi:hypothetical protein
VSHDASLAIEHPGRPGRPETRTVEVTLGGRLRERWSRVRARPHSTVTDWEQPLERFDRLHAEYRTPFGPF